MELSSLEHYPMGYGSERGAGSDHDAKHGDPDERPAFTDPGGGRHARVVLATTEGWQTPDDKPTPESILAHWSEVMAGRSLSEPAGSMSDLLARRGLATYSIMDLVEWTRTGKGSAADWGGT
jgi:hypothetical protein